ncbi:MAG: hypothetical protein H6818_19665 [Phycisphaerales bacterium]|nr:hypothetical protein [Phycisphaerales bacterium]MCB9863685.1 hypothetical protein [Phycisphaerales bacterium]
MGESGRPSKIYLDELFAAEDARFYEYLRGVRAPTLLTPLVERLKRDARPWAREQITAYFSEPLDCRGHELVVKRLFKHAEENGLDGIMAVCAVAFDRLVRRVRRKQFHYDAAARRYQQSIRLVCPRNRIAVHAVHDRQSNLPHGLSYDGYRQKPGDRLFTYRTRYYLRRRAWRYFRRLGYMHPERYVPAIAQALRCYTDDDFATGENIIDNWSLMHACYFNHAALQFTATQAELKEGQSLGQMLAAPYHLDLWCHTDAFDILIDLLADARSGLIRLWSLEMLRGHHEALLKSLTPARLIPLLSHADERVQGFAAEAFANLDNLSSIGIDDWLSLLDTKSIAALTLICDAMKRHVSLDRLTAEQLVDLACARPAPVAQMGFDMVRKRHEARSLSAKELSRLANVGCAAIASESATWALERLGKMDMFDVDYVSQFFDSLQSGTRAAAMTWLDESSLGWNEPALWARLIETPFDDVRFGVVRRLEQRQHLPGRHEADRLAPLWAAVILGVHRGGRRKPDALRQLVRAIVDDPAQAKRLLPIVVIAVRSIRPAERRAALSAVASMLADAPEQLALVGEMIPELEVPALIGEST